MKKKMLAVLLAASLFAGIAVPAFAAEVNGELLTFQASSESGDPSDITQLAFSKSSYTLRNGETLNLANELMAYCGTKQICQEPSLEWDVSESLAISLDYETGTVEAVEDSGSATITVVETNSGKKATCKVTAAKTSATSGYATGFKFEQTSYTFYTGADESEQPVIKIVPTPSGKEFTDKQYKALTDDNFRKSSGYSNKNSVATVLFGGTNVGFVAEQGTGSDEGSILLKVSGSVSEVLSKSVSLQDYEFPSSDGAKTYSSTKKLTIKVVKGVAAQKIIPRGSVKVEVGKIVDLNEYVAYTTGANFGKSCSFEVTPYNDSAETADYAALSDQENGRYLQGVKTGKLKVIATLDGTDATTTLNVEVVAKGGTASDTSKASITPTTGTIAIGDTFKLAAKNVPEDATITWSLDDDSLADLTENEANASIKALAAGTVVVTGYSDGEEIGTAKITITQPAASSTPSTVDPGITVPTIPPSTNNPQTGDCWFSNLF